MKIELKDSATQYKVRGRPEAMKQVFINLFDNAVKYGIENTMVSVEPHVQNKTGNLRIDVIGTSIGFTSEEAKTLCNLGIRGEAAKKKIALSTGLGLYICKTILSRFFSSDIQLQHSGALKETRVTVIIPAGHWYK